MIKLYNTLSRKEEEFEPQEKKKVTFYTCGPTVYDYMHIGNLRTFVFSDILQRTLRQNGYEVLFVQNITDIDDKIIKRAKEKEIAISQVANQYTKYFFEDIEKLNIKRESFYKNPKATEYVNKMIEYIQALIRKEFAYVEDDGSVYFDISKFPDYGKLSQIDSKELKSGTRTLSDEYTKDDVQDFALWKSVEETQDVKYKSPWGWGRPGWHIECSVMSQEILGETIDIHAGGVDLIFPHHENEIAQSEAKSGKTFVKYWVHGAHMLVAGKKMSKSFNNFYRLTDIQNKGIDPLALRYLFFQTHYRQEMNFTFESLQASQNALNRLYREISLLAGEGIVIDEYYDKFISSVNQDLNMPQALSIVWELLKSKNSSSDKKATLLEIDKILGLGLDNPPIIEEEIVDVPDEVSDLIDEREKLRREKRFHLADQVRDKIKRLGFDVLDKEGKTTLVRVDKKDE